MMKMHAPQFEPMGKYHLGSLLSDTFATVQVRLRSILASTQGAITTDGWTSTAGQTYFGFTYHWIEPDWTLHSVPIGISRHQGKSKAEDHFKISNDRNRLLPENAEEFIFLRVAWSKVDTLKRKREVT